MNPQDEIGYATEVNDYRVMVNGLPKVKVNEIVLSSQDARGLVYSLSDNIVEVLMLDNKKIKPKEVFKRSGKQFAINISPALLGRTINPLGVPIDGKGRLTASAVYKTIDTTGGGIKTREFIKEQFETGITTVDALVPLAKGQRELIIGDARSGKTSFLIDMLANMAKKKPLDNQTQSSKPGQNASHYGFVVVYAVLGKPGLELRRLVDVLEANGVMNFTVIVATSSADKAPLVYLTPYTAMTLAEYYQSQGLDVLIVLDDMGLHAKYYREISLLSNKPPGRQSYPGDIFYQHARIVERAGCFRKEFGGGSITALPVIETDIDDMTGFIQTNLMGMTDGHLLFNSVAYHSGQRPAIDIFLSVSRVGRQTQFLIQKQLADKIKQVLSKAEKLDTLRRFGSDLSAETTLVLKQAFEIKTILKQQPLTAVPIILQVLFLGIIFTPTITNKAQEFIVDNKDKIINYLTNIDLKKYESEMKKMKNLEEFISWLDNLLKNWSGK